MRILTDENVPRSVLNWLRATGHDVTSASELGIGAPDTRWLTFAQAEQRLILTADKDFGDLVFRDRLNKKSGAWSKQTHPAALSWSRPIACLLCRHGSFAPPYAHTPAMTSFLKSAACSGCTSRGLPR